eukprot:CAMPEP_0197589040 /NCGR_PEP_ID=MMETSP1326-20131121/10114_1 /TAXON_ID=1155430 /ORGANISM="Genus nov. species nov., Strain RCC2288" /LENGTH=152 /DNA_ID=CAMNT_0043153933 /DNA_START=13 /DNA_END=471 /DNA_ORIENTATION=-
MAPLLATLALIAALSLAAGVNADDECDESMTGFYDNEMKSQAWQDIAHGNVKAVLESIGGDSCYAKMRAADGRGPLFWSHEFYNQKIIDALVSAGADIKAKDKGGKTPVQMPRAPPMTFEAPPEEEDATDYEPDDDEEDEEPSSRKADHSEM